MLAAIPGEWSGPRWLKGLLAIVCALGGVIVSRLKEKAKQDDAHTDALNKSIPTVAPGTAPLVGAWPLRELGVHKALIEIPYLRRDQESELRTALAARKPVLVVGNSMSGNT